MICDGHSGHNPFLQRLEHASMLQLVFLKLSERRYEPDGHCLHADAELAPVMDDTEPCVQSDGNSAPG
jgi:hypothetical protein